MTASFRRTIATTGGAGVIAAAVAFLPAWEGMDRVAKRDAIGTGHPVTYCYGQTDEMGDVKVGTTFTKQQCDDILSKTLPTYLAKIDPCIHVDLPDKTKASLLDAAWNAGPAAVCRSPMVAKMNAGDLVDGCDAFDGWFVRSDGQVRKGLIARRAGEEHGDHRKSERALCLEGLEEASITKAALASPPPVVVQAPQADCPKVIEPQSTPPLKRIKIKLRKKCAFIRNVVTNEEERICR